MQSSFGATRILQHLSKALLCVGAIIILCQIVWISYGVFMRYALNSPDRYATEATALLLFPLAFLGLTYANQNNAVPRVVMFQEMLSTQIRNAVAIINSVIITFVGIFFFLASARATIYTFNSGASSVILEWYKCIFWFPVATSFFIFTLDSILKTVTLVIPNLGVK